MKYESALDSKLVTCSLKIENNFQILSDPPNKASKLAVGRSRTYEADDRTTTIENMSYRTVDIERSYLHCVNV